MPVKILLTKKVGKKKNKRMSIDSMGSQLSGFISLIFIFLCTSYLAYMLQRMFTFKDDISTTSIKTNHFEDGMDQVKFGDKNFLTSIQMRYFGTEETRAKYDIWQEPNDPSNQLLSYEKLSQYINVFYNVEHKVEF